MAAISPFFKFISLLVLLIHLGCFIFTNSKDRHGQTSKKRKLSSLKPKSKQAILSSWSFLKRTFASKSYYKNNIQTYPSSPARSSQRSLIVSFVIPETEHISDIHFKNPTGSCPESDISAGDHLPFPLRNDIFPCTACGEIFPKPQLLDQHQAIKHAVSELVDGDSGNNIVRIIFKTGWIENLKEPIINRILKIHNCPKILSKFEEYRETVKAKAARNGTVLKGNERCIADGNELLRFHCSTFLCDLGYNGSSSICNQQYCSVCGIIKSGFSPKLDGISTLSTSWRAHVAIPEEVEEEFRFMNVKRAMLLCRVVAGRIGSESDMHEVVNKESGGFDSVFGSKGGSSGVHTRTDEEELLVFNPRAVLPCFVIVYTV